jgi:glycosyltransferase involved in cell wall biosynthesis
MKLFILDPGLRGLSGHHYDFVYKLNAYLTSLGHEVKIYCSIDVGSDVTDRFNNITPHFRSFPYPQHHGEILDYHHHSRLMVEDLSTIEDANYWIWPSAFSFQVNGVRLAQRNVKSVGCVHVEHDYHHTIWGKAQWQDATTDRFKLFAMEHKLVEDYVDINVPCQYVPNPADNIPITHPRSHMRTIGFFGHQRIDKGSNKIPSIIDALADDYNVVWHDSGGGAYYNHPNVNCYGSVPILSDIIRLCDLVVLPYDRTKYRKMSSGIMCETLSLGIPCIVPSGTAQADWIIDNHSGVVFEDDITMAISIAREQYQHIANGAYKAAIDWPHKYGIEKFVSTMMSLGNVYE